MEIIKVLQKPKIGLVFSDQPAQSTLQHGQALIRVKSEKDFFNRIFGTATLTELKAQVEVQGNLTAGFWNKKAIDEIDKVITLAPGEVTDLIFAIINTIDGKYYLIHDFDIIGIHSAEYSGNEAIINKFFSDNRQKLIYFPSTVIVSLLEGEYLYQTSFTFNKTTPNTHPLP